MGVIDMVDMSRNLFSVQVEEVSEPKRIHTIKLTPRQYKLHNLLLEHSEHSKGRMTHKNMLERLDSEYRYTEECLKHPNKTFNNTNARRQLSDDLDAITTYGGFHKVYVGGRYATSELELRIHLLKEKIRVKKEWWKLSVKYKKAGLDGQTIMQFSGYEKDKWESYIQSEEEKLKEMENSYESESTYPN